MRVDVRDYQDEWSHEIAERVTKDSILSRIKDGDLPTEEEIDQLGAALAGPEKFFNETNLREAFGQHDAALIDFIRVALGQQTFPSREERIDQRFEAWLIQHNFGPEQARVVANVEKPGARANISARKPGPIGIQSVAAPKGWGGLRKAMQLFGESNLETTAERIERRRFEMTTKTRSRPTKSTHAKSEPEQMSLLLYYAGSRE